MDISTEWCCDLDHPNNPEHDFDKRTFFPGRFIYAGDKNTIYAGAVDESDRVHLNPPKRKKRKAKGPPNRKVIQRGDLQDRLRTWLASAHASDSLRAVRPASFILDAKAIKSLATVHPDRLTSALQVISAVQETAEWGVEWAAQVLAVVSKFDADLECQSDDHSSHISSAKNRQASRPGETNEDRAEDEYQPRAKKPRTDGPLVELSVNVPRRSTRLRDR